MFHKTILGLIITFVVTACNSPKYHKSDDKSKMGDEIGLDDPGVVVKNDNVKAIDSITAKEGDNLPSAAPIVESVDVPTEGEESTALVPEADQAAEAAPVEEAVSAVEEVVVEEPVVKEFKIGTFDVNKIQQSEMQYLSQELNVSGTLKRPGTGSVAGGFFNPITDGQVQSHDSGQGQISQKYYQFKLTGGEGTDHTYSNWNEVLGDKYTKYASKPDSVKTYVYEYTDYKFTDTSPTIEGKLDVIKYDGEPDGELKKGVTIAGEIRVKFSDNKEITIHFGDKSTSSPLKYTDSVVLDDQDVAQSGKLIIKHDSNSKEYDLAELSATDTALLNALGLFKAEEVKSNS